MADISSEQLKKILEEAAERGAKKALAAVGLQDEAAPMDIKDLRDLAKALRTFKIAAVQESARSFVRIIGWTILIAAALFITGFKITN